jgi:hypothetical protein
LARGERREEGDEDVEVPLRKQEQVSLQEGGKRKKRNALSGIASVLPRQPIRSVDGEDNCVGIGEVLRQSTGSKSRVTWEVNEVEGSFEGHSGSLREGLLAQ